MAAVRRPVRYAYWTRARRRRLGRQAHSTAGRGVAITAVAFLAVTFVAALVSAGAVYYTQVTQTEASAAEIIASRGGGARIYDRNGVLLYEFLNQEYGFQERVALAQVSPWLQYATIAAEDASFYTNPGVNVEGLTRAAFENFRPGDEFLQGTGGSSITQQLVKQIYFDNDERQQRSMSRKIKEAVLAVNLTRDYSKQQILEWYLNEISYGGVFRGVQAASRGYFGIDASAVTLAQAAFLAGLPQAPSQYDPFANFGAAIGKQHEVLDLMVHHRLLDAETAAWAKLEEIRLTPAERPFYAPHFVQYVGDYLKATVGEHALYAGGLQVFTTLDLGLQWKANASLEEYLQKYEKSSQGHNGSVVILEPPTGQILVMVGSRDYFREDIDGSVNNALAENSPGSTLKPFTYATAFMQGWGPEWPIVDTAITYREPGGDAFSPRNPDGRTHGVIPAREALGNSYNIPAFKTILWAGVDNVIATAKSMGITTLDRQLGPALTLGGVDVKLLDLVYGYSTFANNGVMAGVPTTQGLPDGNRALDPSPVLRVVNLKGEVVLDNSTPTFKSTIAPEYAYMITSILSEDKNRSVTYGRGSNLNIPGHRVAAKTGTSEPYAGPRRGLIGDTWTVGYTPDLAVGVWVGNTDNSPMVNILSTTIAGSTWHDVFVTALEGRPPRDWLEPAGLVKERVCVPSGRIATEGVSCRSVTGIFAAEALAKQQEANAWGGQTISASLDTRAASARVPEEIDGMKRYLAEEYLRYFRGGVTPAPTPNNDQPSTGNGNGNGNGNRRR